VAVALEAQADIMKTVNRLKVRRRWVFMVISLRKVITWNSYEKINGKSDGKHHQLSLTVVESYAILG